MRCKVLETTSENVSYHYVNHKEKEILMQNHNKVLKEKKYSQTTQFIQSIYASIRCKVLNDHLVSSLKEIYRRYTLS